MQRTPHPKIDKAVHKPDIPQDMLAHIDALITAAQRDDEERVRALLSSLVPAYEAVVPSLGVRPGNGPAAHPEHGARLHAVKDEGEAGEAASSAPAAKSE